MKRFTGTDPDSAGVPFPPPFLYLAGIIAGLLLDLAFPQWVFRSMALTIAGIALALAGIALGLSAIARFRRNETNLSPRMPTTRIVDEGPFRFTRNPIYIGFACLYVGIALIVGSLPMLALIVPIMLVIRHAVIAREERYLEGKFGDTYRSYKRRVRRWV